MNNDACEKLYEAHYMRVFSYMMTLSGDRHLAEEITQETFFRAFRKLDGFRGESDEVTWLCAIARNLFNDEKRRQSHAGSMPEDAVSRERGVEQTAVERDASFRVHMALHALEEPYREVFELRVFGELSFLQIGRIFQRTENWARVTFHRARAKLKERMDEE
uniref:RNA polymerase sigma factor, sigma-70 family n=1 Tax=uncultured bacterium Contig575 TaxID=1393592 RepID=W0FI02_9BACT|nr:RNA polymerase sigma factor, sigma-70 family [uncultured bacterium Contig575]